MNPTEAEAANKARSAALYVEVFGAGNLAAADDLMAPGVVSHPPGLPDRIGADGVKAQAATLRLAIPDLAVELLDQVAEGDRVASHWRATGHHTGPLRMPGVDRPPSGEPIAFTEIRIDRHSGDRIVESWWIPDRFTLWQQLGLIPS